MDGIDANPGGADGAVDGGQQQRERDAEFWYEDGTVILAAHNVEFRVYKGVLAQHSLFFRDMFSLPQPPDADGGSCPIVHLTDSPQDVGYMLQACMVPGIPSLFHREDPSFDFISACVRLGHKYQIDRLLAMSLAQLKSYYTTDLETWQQHRAYHDDYEQELLAGFRDAHAIGVLNLARLTGETSLLPTAFLQCHTLEERVLDGFDRADGTHEELAPEDLKRCMKAKAKLAAASLAIYVRMYYVSISDDCATPDACLAGFREALALLDWYSDIVTRQDPFRALLRIYEAIEFRSNVLCSHCVGLAMARGKEAQGELWKELPSILDIEVEGW